MAKPSQISDLLTALEEVLPRQGGKLSESGVKLYCAVLADIPLEMLEAGVKDILATAKWFPTPADIRRHSTSYTESGFPTALEAWGELKHALAQPRERFVYCEDYLGLERPKLGDPKYWEAIKAMNDHLATCLNCKKEVTAMRLNPLAYQVGDGMGFHYLRMSEDEMADRAHFIKAYDQLAERESQERLLLPDSRDKHKQLESGEKE